MDNKTFWVKPFMAAPGTAEWENTISVVPVNGWLKVEILGFEQPKLEVPLFTTQIGRASCRERVSSPV